METAVAQLREPLERRVLPRARRGAAATRALAGGVRVEWLA
jgi:hypothetical protein